MPLHTVDAHEVGRRSYGDYRTDAEEERGRELEEDAGARREAAQCLSRGPLAGNITPTGSDWILLVFYLTDSFLAQRLHS